MGPGRARPTALLERALLALSPVQSRGDIVEDHTVNRERAREAFSNSGGHDSSRSGR
jgi:hypothetical protein